MTTVWGGVALLRDLERQVEVVLLPAEQAMVAILMSLSPRPTTTMAVTTVAVTTIAAEVSTLLVAASSRVVVLVGEAVGVRATLRPLGVPTRLFEVRRGTLVLRTLQIIIIITAIVMVAASLVLGLETVRLEEEAATALWPVRRRLTMPPVIS